MLSLRSILSSLNTSMLCEKMLRKLSMTDGAIELWAYAAPRFAALCTTFH
ncbi:hypothetical protein SAMN04515668_0306 [Hymenobacter arizonensis]|uniref:Uncharacterized protein n=1 Tax=Hymenobacter arizonensis TaxID=1227077 RepID=A0A1I5T3N3_HYMAR|nr:hypothetical protein SAMN04515668_0306 [Hymenobacter arizonensis]